MPSNTAGQTTHPFRPSKGSTEQGVSRFTGKGNSTGVSRVATARVAKAKATPPLLRMSRGAVPTLKPERGTFGPAQ